LDEPTNDLDIPTLEILEESLLDFPGALVLVTHDRYLLDRVSTVVLGLDGRGGAERFADYSQWELWQAERQQTERKDAKAKPPAPALPRAEAQKKRLSYMESREYETIQDRIAQAEAALHAKSKDLEDPTVMKDGRLLEQTYRE